MRSFIVGALLLSGCASIEFADGPVTEAVDPTTWSRNFSHACVSTVSGRVACLGRNDMMQLGSDRADSVLELRYAEIGPLRLHAPIAGSSTTCALDDESRVWCWGDGEQWPRLAAEGRPFSQLWAGDDAYCGRGADSALYCWRGFGDEFARITGSESFHDIDIGHLNGCGLTTDSTAVCWALGTFTDAVPVPGGHKWRDFSIGTHRCGITAAGVARCQGYNLDLELGVPDPPSPYGDVDVAVATPSTGDTLVQISAGDRHTCALGKTGQVYCWGNGGVGSLGRGYVGDYHDYVPRPVLGLPAAALRVTSRQDWSCADLANGTKWCWGWQRFGEFGLGYTGIVWTPTQIDLSATTVTSQLP